MQGRRVTQSSCLMLQFAKMEAQSRSMHARGQLWFSCPSWHRHRIADSELLSPVTFPLLVSSIGLVSFNSCSRLLLRAHRSTLRRLDFTTGKRIDRGELPKNRKASSLGQQAREDEESSWDLAGHAFRVVAK